jgi:tetratricopeptide (TPR) repeat protein
MHIFRFAFTVLLLTAAMFVEAQSSKDAAKALAEGRPAEAAAMYEKLLQSTPQDADGWENLGAAYMQTSRYTDAQRAFQKAIDTGYSDPAGKYNLACAYARAGDKAHALELLSGLIAQQYSVPIAADPDLASLRDEPQFKELAATVQKLIEPCKDKTRTEFRQLDFWVGEWDVYSGTQKVGDSSIQRILKDCVVLENWTGSTGDSGKSFNKYNTATKKWEQFWVSDTGSTQHFTGELADGEMRYVLEPPTRSGGTLTRHLTFSKLSDSRVRQLSQGSTDGGKTWNTEYDYVYVPKKGATALGR